MRRERPFACPQASRQDRPEADVYSAKLLTKFKAVTGLRKPINDQPR
jgi:hypothetical protein